MNYSNPRANFYLAPPPFDPKDGSMPSSDEQFGWAKDFIQQGRAYLKLQPAHPYIQDSLDLINGDFHKSTSTSLSNVKTDLVSRNLRELNAAQSNLRIIPAIHSDVELFREQSVLLNKCYTYWQGATFADRVFRKAWQNATGLGTGYCSIGYDPDYYGLGRGEIAMRAHGPLDVLPVGLPHDHDIQKAYGVALRIPTPYHQAIAMFPDYADKIKPTQESLQGHGTVIAQSVKFASAVLKRFGPGAIQDREATPWAMVDIYYIFIDDRSTNTTSKPILMGDAGTSWEYTVPYLGEMIETGRDLNGTKHYREARRDDCLLYPNRRLVIATDACILNPDPTLQVNHGWHGKVPLVQFRADDWPWCYLGFPLSKAGMLLEKANIELLRGIVDMMNVRLSPPTGYDRNTMARSLAETINLRIPNQRVGLDYTLAGEQLRPLIPVEYLNTPTNIPDVVMQNESRITHQMGVADAQALARVRQMPASDSAERILEALGPLIKDQSRNMEQSVTAIGNMWIPLCFQWWSAQKRFQLFGDDGLVTDDVDWNPGSFVPKAYPEAEEQYSSYFELARKHAINFHYTVEPYSLHEMNSFTKKMAYMQLSRGGFPLSWWTLAKVWDIANFGPVPRVTDPADPRYGKEYTTEIEKWISQMEIMARFQQAAPGGNRQGRPPSGQQPPSLDVRSDGSSTVRESPK